MNNFDLNEMYNKFNDEHFNSILPALGEKATVKWNHRAIRRAGQIKYVVRFGRAIGGHINLSAKVFAANSWEREKVERTLIHEMCHMYCAIHHNQTGHGRYFQRKMSSITGENKSHRCHNYEVPTAGAKFVGKCSCTTYYRQRTSKHIRRGAYFTCQKCKTKFQYRPV